MLLHLVVLDAQQAGVLVTTFLLLLLVDARELAPLDNANAEITKIIYRIYSYTSRATWDRFWAIFFNSTYELGPYLVQYTSKYKKSPPKGSLQLIRQCVEKVSAILSINYL